MNLSEEIPDSLSGLGKSLSIFLIAVNERNTYVQTVYRSIYKLVFELEKITGKTRFRDSPYNLRELINGNETSLKISGFRKLAPTKIFAHGFSNNGHSNKHVLEMRNGIFPLFISTTKLMVRVEWMIIDWWIQLQNILNERTATLSALIGRE